VTFDPVEACRSIPIFQSGTLTIRRAQVREAAFSPGGKIKTQEER
jgi:hypothetical protein